MDMNWKNFWFIFIGVAVALAIGILIGSTVFTKEVQSECQVNQTICEESGACPEFQECPQVNQTQDCPVYEECLTEEEKKLKLEGYPLDGLLLNTLFSEILSDRELSLFDGEVDFNGNDYDAEEVFYLDVELLANEQDFEGVPYLTVSEGAISYAFNFEPSLDLLEINDKETLVFNLLGEEVELSEWEENKITFTQGDTYTLSEGNSTTVDGKLVTIKYALENKAHINVDGITREVKAGDVKYINGLQVKVEYSFETTEFRTGEVELIIGEEVERVISDGDDYEDSIWEWKISGHSIGLVLVEEFKELDEEFNALELGESICLPNEYLCVYYNGLLNEDKEEYSFELDNEYVEARGNFLSGINDYDRVYIDSTGIYSDDEMSEGEFLGVNRINLTTIELGDTDSVLNLETRVIDDITTFWIVVEDFEVNLSLGLAKVLIDDVLVEITGDENYLTNYGIFVEDPEDALDDNYFEISVPEEELEGSLVVKQGKPEEPVCDVNNLELCLDENTCTDAEGYWYSDVCNVEEEIPEE